MTAPSPRGTARRPLPARKPGLDLAAREESALLAGLLAALAFLPVFVLAAPSSAWSPATLVLTLAAIALFSYLGGVAAGRSVLVDAGFLAALAAVALLGPLPAACIWISTEIVALAFERVRASAFLANVVSYGWAALAGSLVLAGVAPVTEASAAGAYGAVALAGIAMLVVNFFFTRTLIAVVRDGGRPADVLRTELIAHSPATVAMTALATASVFLYAHLGVLALAGFALVVTVPQVALPRLRPRRAVADLDHASAVALYADAMAYVLKLDSDQRLVLKDAAAYMRERQLRPRTGNLSDLGDGHRLSLVEAVLFHGEHWDGEGGKPGAVGGEMIPIASRVLAVADAWGGLTAKGSPELSHSQALHQLEARAGMHFDPIVVAAAAQVVQDERDGISDGVAYAPRRHRELVPRVSVALRTIRPSSA